MTIRTAVEADLPELRVLFADSVRATGAEAYTPAQVAMWASFAGREEEFRRFILDPHTILAEADGTILGFAGLGADGHVASLYVRGGHQRRGIGSALLNAVMARAAESGMTRLHTEASAFSRPLFERYGFRTWEVERVERSGVFFERYRMRRDLVR